MAESGLDRLPPVFQLLLREWDDLTDGRDIADSQDVVKKLKKLVPELERQAEWTIDEFENYYDWTAEPDSQFRIALVEGLDPLSPHAKCADIACRGNAVVQIARSVGLYADRALVYDSLTDRIFFTDEWDIKALMSLLKDCAILHALRPLLEAGFFELVNPFTAMCSECHSATQDRAKELSDQMYRELKSELSVTVENNELRVDTDLLGTPIVYRGALSNNDLKSIDGGGLDEVVARKWGPNLSMHIDATLGMLRTASMAHAVTFSNSRAGMMAAREVDGRRPAYNDVASWEARRSANLPWIGDLTMHQIVQLREEADSALPRFRERMSRLMLADDTGNQIGDIVAELNEEAMQVEQELQALRFPQRTRVQKALAALTIVVYGCAADSVGPGATAGLAALLHHLHRSHSQDAQEYEGIISRPGYVLAKAKELSGHVHG